MLFSELWAYLRSHVTQSNEVIPLIKEIPQHHLLNQPPRRVSKKQKKLSGRKQRGVAVKK